MRYNKNPFSAYAPKKQNKSRFHMPHTWNHDFAIGKAIPVLTIPTLPGDEFDISSEFYFQFDPLYYPAFGMINMDVNYYWVANRICWRTTTFTDALGSGDGWEAFITYSAELEHPYVSADMQLLANGEQNDCVLGYMNLPYIREAVGFDDKINHINCIPLSAYLLIVDTFIRNDKLEPGRWFNLSPGENNADFNIAFEGYTTKGTTPTDGRFRVLSSKWEWDYLTSCTPTPQLGDAIKIPMMGEDISGNTLYPYQWVKTSDGTDAPDGAFTTAAGGESRAAGEPVGLDIQETAADMRQLRLAEVLQSYKERLLKIGQRYADYLKGMFGRAPEPGSIDLPLWFGNYTARVEISPTYAQATTEVGEKTYKTGQYAGNARLYKKGGDLHINVREHGWIIAILEMRPTASYGQGIDRWWRYALPTDYPLDMFANIGDQEVLKEEVMYNSKTGKSALNQGTFGYIERYAEMKFLQNRYGSNLTGYTGKQEWAKSIHDGRIWSEGIMDDDTRYNDQIEISKWFVSVIRHNDGGVYWPSYTGDNGQFRTDDLFNSLTLPYNLGTTKNPIIGLIYHDIWVNRALPFHSTPALGVQ